LVLHIFLICARKEHQDRLSGLRVDRLNHHTPNITLLRGNSPERGIPVHVRVVLPSTIADEMNVGARANAPAMHVFFCVVLPFF
jgi:hypothetical protein